MALMHRYNPPPNWPTPPPGWAPPPGWQPDPTWGPPPPDWPIWVQERANPNAWLWAFVAAGTFYALLVGTMLVLTGGAINWETAGEFLSPFLVGAIVVGAIGWARPKRWGVWFYFVLVFAVFMVLRVISVAANQGNS